ncbi:MAG TPA: DUF2232 domain-containing protein [Xanthobacteraceae bacterium]|jgi:hypothetical protein
MTRFWWNIGLVGLAAGLCSALLFASIYSGSSLSLLLCCLVPLPIMIAAMGWSHWAGLAAIATASVLLGLAIDPLFLFGFPVTVGLGAWWLGYLALLARPAGPNGELEWYPVGRLVLWAAILSALVTLVGLAAFGGSAATIQKTLHTMFEHMLRLQLAIPADAPLVVPGVEKPQRLIDIIIAVLPPATAVLTTITQLLNLWLAGHVVKISGRLRRPWPDLAAMRLPPVAMAALAIAFVGSFVPGLPGMAAQLPVASLIVAYAALGFAVMHGITRHLQGRTVVLVGLYTGFVLLGWSGWPVLVMALLGLIDSAVDLRRRVAATRGPPPLPPPERT